MKVMQFSNFAIPLCILLFSCQAPTAGQKEVEPPRFISVDEAKAIVAEDVYHTEFYNQYFILGSPQFDERVREISWGEPVLVKGIPDGDFYKEEFYYYVLTGVMPDGRILAAKTVNAVTGELLSGQLWVSARSDVLKQATVSEIENYASQRTGISVDKMRITAVYDEASFAHSSLILTWKYLVEEIDAAKGSRGLESGDYVLADPYIRDFGQDPNLKPGNATFYDRGLNHRLFRYSGSIPSGYGSRTLQSPETGISLTPVD